jgi:hypothetical protein
MKCPHCQTDFHDNVEEVNLGNDTEGWWHFEKQKCPACLLLVLQLVQVNFVNTHSSPKELQRYLVRPKAALRPAPPPQVPTEFSQDYIEASLILTDSPKASAALSRRCLQHILREKAGVRCSDLAKEIEEVLASRQLPSYLAEDIDAVRNIGNFAAHPIKAKSTGEIVPVEPGEAEWNLDVLDGLFDFYFVQPAIAQQKREALNAKLASAGKPPTKT